MSHHHGAPFGGDYDPYYGGGGYYGHGDRMNDISMFMMDPNVKMYWIAFFALLAYWGLLWFLRHAFGDGHYPKADTAPARTSGGEESNDAAPAVTGFRRWVQRPNTSSAHSRLTRASEVLSDLILMLLSVLVLNTFGQGSTRLVMILTWVFFGCAIFWSIFEASKESHIARFLFGMVFYGLILAIGGLSFAYGFHSFYD